MYRIINAWNNGGNPIYLVDVPGFADSKISVNRIVSMLKETLQAHLEGRFFYILYFTPIDKPRLSGSQRRVLRTFQALTGTPSGQSVTIVTTMWDLIWSETARARAESNFRQFQDEIWKV
ncbi:hypothetical protein BJ165DRAFT_1517937, partial [Panaeolus papilionaceus]